ncbi:MAG TPA: Hsp70 family protein, partial [Fervidobacterium sp.]|nr:Hsp70 family protein [Fervidobacterium sp.]
MAYIGIDLGTSTCEIAYYKDGKVELIPDLNGDIIIPSYIGVDQEGNFIYGRIAKNQFIARRRYTTREFKRLMGTNTEISVGDKQYSPEEVSAMMLAYLKKSAEVYLNKKIDEVIVTVPANFDDNQRSATMRAIQMSGLRCERIINEPTAASMTYGLDNIDEESTILVFDFGGGTLDITILEMFDGILDVKASHGDTQLGGKDFDERMKGIIIEKLRTKGIAVSEQDDELMAKIYSMSEDAKIALSNERKVSVQLENIRVGNELQDIEIEITRDEFEAKIEDLIKRSENLVMEAVKAAGMEIEDINNVILVGGTTKVPVVRQRLSRLLNKILRTDVEPDTAVAKGAAIQIAIKSGLIDSKSGLLVTDVCPYSLGTETAEIMDGFLINGLYHEMIKRNTTIPCERTDVFVPLSPEQEIVSVKVYQTLNENCKLVKDAKLIGEF